MAKTRHTSRARSNGRRAPSASDGLLFPLDLVYSKAGIAVPRVRQIQATDIPMPYRLLLAHQNDMTLTLEGHFGGPVLVRPLSAVVSGPWYLRRVLLVQQSSGRPVEMGAIRLRLAAFPARVRARILRSDVPLGRLLREAGVEFQSQPRAFLAIIPNPEMMGVFWMRDEQTLYGRRTELLHEGSKIGDIVEILPLA